MIDPSLAKVEPGGAAAGRESGGTTGTPTGQKTLTEKLPAQEVTEQPDATPAASDGTGLQGYAAMATDALTTAVHGTQPGAEAQRSQEQQEFQQVVGSKMPTAAAPQAAAAVGTTGPELSLSLLPEAAARAAASSPLAAAAQQQQQQHTPPPHGIKPGGDAEEVTLAAAAETPPLADAAPTMPPIPLPPASPPAASPARPASTDPPASASTPSLTASQATVMATLASAPPPVVPPGLEGLPVLPDWLRQREVKNQLPLVCQVVGCGADLVPQPEYYQRLRVCREHLKAPALVVEGTAKRFCQQCGKFHELEAFDGDRRNCRARLEQHNSRRRKVAAASGNGSQVLGQGSFRREFQGDMAEMEGAASLAAVAAAAAAAAAGSGSSGSLWGNGTSGLPLSLAQQQQQLMMAAQPHQSAGCRLSGTRRDRATFEGADGGLGAGGGPVPRLLSEPLPGKRGDGLYGALAASAGLPSSAVAAGHELLQMLGQQSASLHSMLQLHQQQSQGAEAAQAAAAGSVPLLLSEPSRAGRGSGEIPRHGSGAQQAPPIPRARTEPVMPSSLRAAAGAGQDELPSAGGRFLAPTVPREGFHAEASVRLDDQQQQQPGSQGAEGAPAVVNPFLQKRMQEGGTGDVWSNPAIVGAQQQAQQAQRAQGLAGLGSASPLPSAASSGGHQLASALLSSMARHADRALDLQHAEAQPLVEAYPSVTQLASQATALHQQQQQQQGHASAGAQFTAEEIRQAYMAGLQQGLNFPRADFEVPASVAAMLTRAGVPVASFGGAAGTPAPSAAPAPPATLLMAAPAAAATAHDLLAAAATLSQRAEQAAGAPDPLLQALVAAASGMPKHQQQMQAERPQPHQQRQQQLAGGADVSTLLQLLQATMGATQEQAVA